MDEDVHVRHVAVGIMLITLVGSLVYVFQQNSLRSEVSVEETELTKNATSLFLESDHVWGDRDAPLKIVEYSDLECPYCRNLHLGVLPTIKEKYGDILAYSYRHFPLPHKYPKGPRESEAAECVAKAGGEEAFWLFLDGVFNSKFIEKDLLDADLKRLAVQYDIDEVVFDECLASGEMISKVERDKARGAARGVNITPTIFIQYNGETKKVEGSYRNRVLDALKDLVQY